MEKNTMQGNGIEKKTYSVPEIACILGIKERNAYNLCHNTKDFKVLRFGRTIRVHKESFDKWFSCDSE